MGKHPKGVSGKTLETERKLYKSGFRVILTATIVAVIAITSALILKSSFNTEKSVVSTNEKFKASNDKLPSEKKRRRKLSPIMEYEDMFDNSAAVSKWDRYRPSSSNGKLKSLFALYDEKNFLDAKREFLAFTAANPSFFWARYGAAISADQVAELGKTNVLLEETIELYQAFCGLHPDVSEMSIVEREAELGACRRLADRFSFRGWSKMAIDVLSDLSKRFPDEKCIHHDVGVQLLLTGQQAKAKELFEMLVKKDPSDGFASVHLGFILKTTENDFEHAVPYLISGVRSGQPGVKDGRFYYHLGDALVRLGRADEAETWYEEGYRKGVFLSPLQRSLYSVANLKAKPWWTISETGHESELRMLMDNWKKIRKEGLANLDPNTGLFKPEDENLRDYGDWKQFTLYTRGSKIRDNCRRAPVTCSLVDRFPDAALCRRGQVKFSVMKPNTHVWPHTGPTNCRLRSHLGLKVPGGAFITVAKQTKQWSEGKIIILDDSFEHHVWHNGTEDRLILIIDFWHPQLSAQQKEGLRPI